MAHGARGRSLGVQSVTVGSAEMGEACEWVLSGRETRKCKTSREVNASVDSEQKEAMLCATFWIEKLGLER